MAVTYDAVFDKGRFPRCHEGLTPFDIAGDLPATMADEDKHVFAKVPRQFALPNTGASLVVTSGGGGTAVVGSIEVIKADGTVVLTLATGVAVSAAGDTIAAAIAGSPYIGPAADPGEDVYLAFHITSLTTMGAINLRIGGFYAAGMKPIS